MTTLKLHMLGDFEVIRDKTVLDLPPSRKTRGLLAYLALNPRSMRRERLCELLWEIPDDPRGSLRWSLSKIRKLVDQESAPRILADRNTVAFDTSDVDIDVKGLYALVAGSLQHETTEVLIQAVDHYQGRFLEGLDLDNFHDFYTWCIAEREQTTRAQATLLTTIGKRLADQPEQALPYVNRLVSLVPDDENARVALIKLLVRLQRHQEAEQHYRIGKQRLQEAGTAENGALRGALRPVPDQALPEAEPRVLPKKSSAGTLRVDKSLVGRDEELATIGRLIAQLPVAESARVLLIRGEPGIGKSCLLQAGIALARQAKMGILKASAFESEMIRPFGVWNDALRRALPDNATSALLTSGEPVSRDAVFQSLSDVLRQETARHPVVVFCDDVQWCDESSASAVNHVLRMNRRQPLLVIATSRETALRDNPAVQQVLRSLRHDKLLEELHLNALTPEQMQKLISLNAPGADAEGLSRECGGNPLLGLELARAGLQGGKPGSLSELVRDRLSRLDAEAEGILYWAAVLSPRVNVKALQQVTALDSDAIAAALEAAERQGILCPGKRGLRFSHDLITQSIYEDIPTARRQAMHRRVAELLEVDAKLDLALAADLSHHAQRGGDPALAGRAMVSAGKLCLRFYANEDAMNLYYRGQEYIAQLDGVDRVCLTLDLCQIRLTAAPQDDWEKEVGEFVQLAEQAIDYGALSHARLGYQMASYVRWVHGQWSDARRFSLQAERVVRGATDEAQILGMGEAAKCLAMLEQDLSQADAMAMEASALAGRINYRCPPVSAALGILRYYEDRPDEAMDYLEDARTLSKSMGDHIDEYLANEYLALIEIERGDYSAGLDRCRILVDIGCRLREGSESPFALALEAVCDYGENDNSGSLDEHLQALRLADAKQRLTIVLNRAAMLDIERDRLEAALPRALEALSLSRTMERPSEILQACLNLEEIHRRNNELIAESRLGEIEDLASGAVAGWVRKRAGALLGRQ